jgi:hypothetical protein
MYLKIRNKWVKNAILASLSVFLIAGGLFIGFGVHEANKLKAIAERYYHQREEKFKVTPNVIDGMVLMEKSWKREEYKKTIGYAEYCTKSGIDSTRLGWFVHALMASAHSKTGNQESACSQANLAVTLAQREHIPDENLKEYGTKEILDKCSKGLANP